MQETSFLFELNTQNINDKVKISPIGDIVGVDGRKYSLNAASVLENMKKIGCDLVLDKDHEDSEAMGWFALNSLEIRQDGIYASLELNELGRNLVEKKIFRYLSPAFACELKDGLKVVERIASVGLVNRPNVVFEALNKERSMDMSEIEKLREELRAALNENEELKKILEDLRKEKKEAEANFLKERIENAIERSEMLPARKESALSLNKEALDAYLEVCKEEAKHILKNKSAEFKSQDKDDGIDESVKAQLGL